MAFKFLNRPEAKQRILRIDLTRSSGTGSEEEAKKGYERALVVTAETDRLTYFWNHSSGDWHFHTRAHAPLRPLAVAPQDTLVTPWSRRNGVAMDGDLAAVVFKRELADGEAAALFLDLLAWSEADAEWTLMTLEKPIPIPLGFRRLGAGIDVWAWLSGRDLQIVTQLWNDGIELPGRAFRDPQAVLALLQARVDPEDLQSLEDGDGWKISELDRGGFDLDARMEQGRIWAVHRRTADAMSIKFDPVSDNVAVWMLDVAGTNRFNIDESLFVADLPPTIVISCDPATAEAKVEADDLPGVEHPQIQRVDPLIVTGDRLRFVSVDARLEGKQWRLEPRVEQAVKVMLWRATEWRMASIGPIEPSRLPLNLRELAPAHSMIDVRNGRISLATMLALKPTYLWRFDVTTKGVELTFCREDRRIGGIACDVFLATPNLLTGEPHWTGMSVLDLGHEQIALDLQGVSAFTAENTQFNGRLDGPTTRLDGGTPDFHYRTANTLGGLLVAHQDTGHGLCAYVGMGDGGGRVIFESKVEPVAPTTHDFFKSLPPEVVAGPGGTGRAWVELEAPDFVAGGLPGYPAPYSDSLRRLAPPQDALAFMLVFLPAEILLAHFTPRSLGGGMQPLLDLLPVANALFNPDSQATLDDIAAPSFDLSENQADAIQGTLGKTVPARGPIDSDSGQPFAASVTLSTGLVQARSPIEFRAQVIDPAVIPTAFTWTFTPPIQLLAPFTLTGAVVSVFFGVEGRWSMRLRIDASDGNATVIDHALEVAPTLWRTVWSAYRAIDADPRFKLGTTTLELMRHRIEYQVGADGTRENVHINYLSRHDASFRFDAGAEAQQGRTMLRLPVTLSSVDGTFSGVVGVAVTLKRADVRLWLDRPFTLGVVTSDRRSFDVMLRETYAKLDSTDVVKVTADQADVETVRHFGFEPGRAANMTPNALAAKPVGASKLTLRDVKVEVDLTAAASGITFLLGVIAALSLGAVVAGPLLIAVTLALGSFGIGALALAALVTLAITVGLGWLFVLLARAAINALANAIAQDALRSAETLATIASGLDEAGVMNYAGEGLAEAIAIQAIRTAIADGHAVEPPTHEQPDPEHPGSSRRPTGRERFRPQFFETVVVGPGVCRVLLRIP